MSPGRFEEIEELYFAARGKTAAERAVLLAETDPELRREVESLLAQRSGGELLDRPALQNAPELLDDTTRTELPVSGSMGPYRIESKLGEGGMGEVFRAVDTRLGRAVALKITREQFGVRFEREARAISSLNHPNICTLYDVGPNYLVMELVEGDTLATRLKSGPLPVKTALLFASQILAALVEAHAKGVVHRDLKPSNIMVAKSGIKILDFGLAKSSHDETITGSHMILGTPAYMAPEQKQGKPADARSDLYSFGRVFYEMLSGGRAGSGRRRLRSGKLERIVNRCLEEDPARRWQSAAEVERELSKVIASTGTWKAVVAAAVIVAVFAGGWIYFHRAPKLTDQDTLVVADFDNQSGDPVFDETLRQGLAVELEQSPFLSLVPDTTVQQTLAFMRAPKDARVTSERAQQICERTGSAVVLEGSIAPLGSQFVLGLRAKNCASGRVLYHEQAVAARREDILNTLSGIARKFRTTAGESLATVEKHSTPLEKATTSSLEALKEYSIGMKVHLTSAGSAAGIPFFRRAVEIDPQFAMAYANLGLSYNGLGQSVLSAESTEKAWRLRDRVSERERFFIDFLYNRQVTGNLEKAYQTLESWLQVYPRAAAPPSPQDLLAGIATNGTGRFERSIEMARKEVADHPDISIGYGGLAGSYFYLGRFSEAESVLQRAFDRKLGNPNHLVMRYNIALLTGDQDQVNRVVALAKGKREAEHRLAHAQALALARSGRLNAARELSNRAVALALQEGDDETSASYEAARAVWEAICGKAAEGKASASAAVTHSKGRDVEYAAGLALALSGDFSRSESLAGGLESLLPEDTFVKFTYAPVLHAIAALGQGKPADSVGRLEIAIPYELAANGLIHGHFYMGGLHSAYVRGEALMATHRYAEASAEFQKILDHRGIVGLDPIGALAHWRLGRVYASTGDTARAKSAYEAFFTLWKDADPDVPVLKQARSEYARLH